ncbi:DUF4142 domain-containing protein [Pseudoroseomonas cervicalis]|uniref:DUF4142 domain-containing protein n=1 Tax=Teichococcus cervicalis TaxID=204525 RepID=UPI002789F6C0|nr:DUF4142 domain-containing protein [Pseudoroseomonas cervicalis]MDQ1081251.1 putative outer membrane protein [Pseudoroseomonas cervicalis]
MQRRVIMTGLAGAALLPLTAASGLAQPAPGMAAPGADGLAPWRLRVLAGGVFSMRSSALAAERARTPAVRAFAHFETAEQEGLLRAMQLAGLPVPAQVPLPGEALQELQALQTLQGGEFERRYLAGQTATHEALLQAQQALLTGGLPPERVIAALAVPGIEQHIAMLRGIG